MKRMLIVPLLCMLTFAWMAGSFGCEEISNNLDTFASDLETTISDLASELDAALNGTQGEPNGGDAAKSVQPATEAATAQTTKPTASQPALPPEMFTGKVVRKRFTKSSGMLSNDSFRLIVQDDGGRAISFNLRGRGAENMDFLYDLHDSVTLPLDLQALKKKFNLSHARFMDVDIQLHQLVTTQPAAKPVPVPESPKPEPSTPPVVKEPEFGTLFDEDSQS